MAGQQHTSSKHHIKDMAGQQHTSTKHHIKVELWLLESFNLCNCIL